MEVEGGTCEGTDVLPTSTLELYESQFFGFTPQTFMFRLSSAFLDSLSDILSVVEKVCVRQLSHSASGATTEEQLAVQVRESSRKFQAFIGERFKKLSESIEELLVARCFSVPPNVLLKEDQCHRKRPPDIQEMLRMESSITELRRAHEAEVCARHALEAELEEQAEVQKQLDEFLALNRELQAAWLVEGNGSFQERFQLVVASVKKLQEDILEVCNKVPSSN
ncbi:protein MIS12 homolog [Syngnathoides biaculeatus]|uniref:protein MIS12 homolog n=1 Tax=Syngnathoides biaculeatus TaxID=300417 RepID=UPI002ADE8879|nr:protein MIS12 homolog [Syngnathoides biaculeatus]